MNLRTLIAEAQAQGIIDSDEARELDTRLVELQESEDAERRPTVSPEWLEQFAGEGPQKVMGHYPDVYTVLVTEENQNN